MIPTARDTQLALRVLRDIQAHSKAEPITGATLAFKHTTTVRRIQNIVEELRDAGFKVAASMGDPYGYFITDNPEDMRLTAAHFHSRAMQYLARERKIMDFSQGPELSEQEAA